MAPHMCDFYGFVKNVFVKRTSNMGTQQNRHFCCCCLNRKFPGGKFRVDIATQENLYRFLHYHFLSVAPIICTGGKS